MLSGLSLQNTFQIKALFQFVKGTTIADLPTIIIKKEFSFTLPLWAILPDINIEKVYFTIIL
jgi:hypothetical protein